MTKYEKRLNQIVEILKGFKPEKIYVFGSRVWGDSKRESDIDIAMIVDPKTDRLETERKFYQKLIDTNYPYDIEPDLHIISKDVFEYRLVNEDPFVSDIAKGKVLYGQ